ncbi:MAG: element excision factor XisH family protein, partial [Bacteroidota bacterium]
QITADPFTIFLKEDDTFLDVDLSAEKKNGGDELERLLAIEIKSFAGSVINSFHEALGQFLDYQAAMEEQNINRTLFLAVSTEGWNRLNKLKFVQRRIRQFGLRFMVVNISTKSIVQWIR